MAERQPIDRDGLESLCEQYNAARARVNSPQRYRIDKSGEKWKLALYDMPPRHIPMAPVIADSAPRYTQAEVDKIAADRGRELSMALDMGAIVKSPDGTYRPA